MGILTATYELIQMSNLKLNQYFSVDESEATIFYFLCTLIKEELGGFTKPQLQLAIEDLNKIAVSGATQNYLSITSNGGVYDSLSGTPLSQQEYIKRHELHLSTIAKQLDKIESNEVNSADIQLKSKFSRGQYCLLYSAIKLAEAMQKIQFRQFKDAMPFIRPVNITSSEVRDPMLSSIEAAYYHIDWNTAILGAKLDKSKENPSRGGKGYGQYHYVMEFLAPYIKRFWVEELENGRFITRRKEVADLVLKLLENHPDLFPIRGIPTINGIVKRINIDCSPLPEQATRTPPLTKDEAELATKLESERIALIVNERARTQ